MFYLVIILGLFFIIIKMLARKNKFVLPGRTVRSLGGMPLGQNKSVQVVEIGSSLYVLGVGNDIRLVARIDDPAEIDAIRSSAAGTGEGQSFPALKDWLASLTKRKAGGDSGDAGGSFQRIFQEKMLTMTNRKKKVEEWIIEDNPADGRKTEDE
jgi:flagellar protein FliO/FliZ